MRKNKGFTLVELIVVIVIIGVLATVAGLTIATVNATSAKKAAAQINAYISAVRTDCMARAGNPYAVLYVEDGVVKGTYYEYKGESNERSETTVVTDRRVTVTYHTVNGEGTSSGETSLPTSEATGMQLKFARSTGKLVEPVGSGTLTISITGGGKTYTITVLAATGNHEIDG